MASEAAADSDGAALSGAVLSGAVDGAVDGAVVGAGVDDPPEHAAMRMADAAPRAISLLGTCNS
jgi:hypothetical protein